MGRSPKMDAQIGYQQPARELTDEELLAKYDMVEQEKFFIPPEIMPNGMTYEWKTKEVLGRPNVTGMSSYQRRGWEFVPAERHPGRWTPEGTQGPLELDGMVLMEIPTERYIELRRVEGARARQPIKEIRENLGAAPPGTAPRTANPRTAPSIRRSYEPLPVE
jgi:hypothetical protein